MKLRHLVSGWFILVTAFVVFTSVAAGARETEISLWNAYLAAKDRAVKLLNEENNLRGSPKATSQIQETQKQRMSAFQKAYDLLARFRKRYRPNPKSQGNLIVTYLMAVCAENAGQTKLAQALIAECGKHRRLHDTQFQDGTPLDQVLEDADVLCRSIEVYIKGPIDRLKPRDIAFALQMWVMDLEPILKKYNAAKFKEISEAVDHLLLSPAKSDMDKLDQDIKTTQEQMARDPEHAESYQEMIDRLLLQREEWGKPFSVKFRETEDLIRQTCKEALGHSHTRLKAKMPPK